MSNLVMLAGVPGSGKTTWARTFFDLKYTIVCPDAIRIREFGSLEAFYAGDKAEVLARTERVFDVFHSRISEAVDHAVDVIADATHLTARGRRDVRSLARGVRGVKTHLVLFKNVQEAVARNAARVGSTRVPETVQQRMVDGYHDLLADLQDGERALYDSVTMIESFA
jgi:predicted kinase